MNLHIKAVVFDMDGVIFDTERIYADAWHEVGSAMNIQQMDIMLRNCIGLNGEDAKNYFIKVLGKEFPFEEFQRRTSQVYHQRIKDTGLPLKYGVEELLQFLKDQQYKIGLASSTKKTRIIEHLEKANLNDYFQTIISGDMVEYGKPNPEIYLKACDALEVNPKECIGIEDSSNGIRASSAAGLMTIFVPDLAEVSKEVESLLFAKMDSLIEIKNWLIKSLC